jgi:hypothetical protein
MTMIAATTARVEAEETMLGVKPSSRQLAAGFLRFY